MDGHHHLAHLHAQPPPPLPPSSSSSLSATAAAAQPQSGSGSRKSLESLRLLGEQMRSRIEQLRWERERVQSELAPPHHGAGRPNPGHGSSSAEPSASGGTGADESGLSGLGSSTVGSGRARNPSAERGSRWASTSPHRSRYDDGSSGPLTASSIANSTSTVGSVGGGVVGSGSSRISVGSSVSQTLRPGSSMLASTSTSNSGSPMSRLSPNASPSLAGSSAANAAPVSSRYGSLQSTPLKDSPMSVSNISSFMHSNRSASATASPSHPSGSASASTGGLSGLVGGRGKIGLSGASFPTFALETRLSAAELRRELAQQRKLVADMERISESQTMSIESERKFFAEQIEAVMRHLEGVEAHIERKEKQFEEEIERWREIAAEKDTLIHRLDTEKRSLEDGHHRLTQTYLSEKDLRASEVMDFETNVREFRENNVRLEAENSQLKLQIENLQQEKEAAESVCDSMAQQGEAMRDQHMEHIRSLEMREQALTDEWETVQTTFEAMEEEVSAERALQEKLREDNQRLRSTMEDMDGDFKNTLERMKMQLQHSREELDTVKSFNQDLHRQVQTVTLDRDRLRIEAERWHREAERWEHECGRMIQMRNDSLIM